MQSNSNNQSGPMLKCTTIFLAIFFASCLEDGRSEADFLSEYAQFVDLGEVPVPSPYSIEDGNYQSENFVIRREETEACSTPGTTNFGITIIQNVQPSIRVFRVDPENDCEPTYLFDLPKGQGSRMPGWEGVVYRFVDYDEILIMEVEVGKLERADSLVIE